MKREREDEENEFNRIKLNCNSEEKEQEDDGKFLDDESVLDDEDLSDDETLLDDGAKEDGPELVAAKGPSNEEFLANCTEDDCLLNGVLVCNHFTNLLPPKDEGTLFLRNAFMELHSQENTNQNPKSLLIKGLQRRMFDTLCDKMHINCEAFYHVLHLSHLLNLQLTDEEHKIVLTKCVQQDLSLVDYFFEFRNDAHVRTFKLLMEMANNTKDQEIIDTIKAVGIQRACRWKLLDLIQTIIEPNVPVDETTKLVLLLECFEHSWHECFEKYKNIIDDVETLSKYKSLLRNLHFCECRKEMNKVVFKALGKNFSCRPCSRCDALEKEKEDNENLNLT